MVADIPASPRPSRDAIPRIPRLGGARGRTVLLVLFGHAGESGMRSFPGFHTNRCGKHGVFLFLVLSAFLLTRQFSLLNGEGFFRGVTCLNDGSRRFLRIFAPHAVVLAAYGFMNKLPRGEASAAANAWLRQ
jgi:peptidoglycan/LPS O-acetylase OafA/YrhL